MYQDSDSSFVRRAAGDRLRARGSRRGARYSIPARADAARTDAVDCRLWRYARTPEPSRVAVCPEPSRVAVYPKARSRVDRYRSPISMRCIMNVCRYIHSVYCIIHGHDHVAHLVGEALQRDTSDHGPAAAWKSDRRTVYCVPPARAPWYLCRLQFPDNDMHDTEPAPMSALWHPNAVLSPGAFVRFPIRVCVYAAGRVDGIWWCKTTPT